jgi:hypothetical protein
MNQQLPNSTQGVFVYNQLNIQEVVVETSGVGADRDSGGMQINMIPRTAATSFSGIATVAYRAEAGGEEHHAGAARRSPRSESRRVAEEVP